MENRLAIESEATGVVRHQALSLSLSDGLAQIGFGMKTEIALTALGCVERDNMISRVYRGHTFAHFNNNTRTFMP